jgi:tRNA A-37 threonylcarbamoyl transferase component Bud32
MWNKWNKIVKKAFGESTEIIFPRFFESKKNQVTLLELTNGEKNFNVIAKYFVWGDPEKEWNALTKAYNLGIKVPKPIMRLGEINFIEFIPGKTLKNIVEKDLSNFEPSVLGSWFGKFHKAFTLEGGMTTLRGDAMLPNFIIHKDSGQLYGVDFEESEQEKPDKEIADIIATLLIIGTPNNPIDFKRPGIFIKSYQKENPTQINPDSIFENLITQLQRRIRFMPYRKEEFESYIETLRDNPDMVYEIIS